MAKNELYQPGNQLSIPIQSGATSGTPTLFGDLGAVALHDRDSSGRAVCSFIGVYSLSVVFSGAATEGAAIYIDTTTYALGDASGAGKKRFGNLVLAPVAGAGTFTVAVRLNY